jgi:mannose-6-phosphate isomerase-like protein (cupin superfamily)
MNKVVSVMGAAAGLQEKWSPRVIAEVDDVYVKVAKVRGQLAWHTHENEDEFFMVLKGHLRIELDDGNVELREGESFVVPKGVRHNPVADSECQILLIERKSTLHTGRTVTEKTRSIAEQLQPL